VETLQEELLEIYRKGKQAENALEVLDKALTEMEKTAIIGLCNTEPTLENLLSFRERIRSIRMIRQTFELEAQSAENARKKLGL
jgi:hypothetical protein